ncbi:MAG: ATP-binding cassette domain-containing protein [bacterium]|nr:ATP-binding cassette domain-containing protein [bacterium]
MSLLQVEGLCKHFGGVAAVQDVDFSVDAGEILALIGPNGSGKSTTLSMVVGIVAADRGSVRLEGVRITGWPTHRIVKAGVGIVFQHSRPLHRQSVLEHIELALLPDSVVRALGAHRIEARAREIARLVGLESVLDLHPDVLPYAALRRMELAKAIARDPRLLLLDEPFAGLTSSEVEQFAALIRSLRESGRAIVLVDHNVKAVFGAADRIVALHAGRKIAQGLPREVLDDAKVREVYFGGSLDGKATVGREARAAGNGDGGMMLSISGLSVLYGKAQALQGVDIEIRAGEFVSVVGLNGAGKSTLLKAVTGFVPHRGEIRWHGEALRGRAPASIARAGIVMCPEGRELFGRMTVRENLELGGFHLPLRELAAQMEQVFELFPILETRAGQAAGTLSGGEQQMLVIGRALMQRPRLLLLDEPTLGLAPVVMEAISEAFERMRRELSLTVLFAEQNVTFALRHAQRVYVLESGRIEWQGPTERFVEEHGAAYL